MRRTWSPVTATTSSPAPCWTSSCASPHRHRAEDATMEPEVVVEDVRLGEGPAWRAGSQDLLVTSVHDGVLWLVDPDRGDKRVFARTGGGPNSSVAADDGGAVVP